MGGKLGRLSFLTNDEGNKGVRVAGDIVNQLFEKCRTIMN